MLTLRDAICVKVIPFPIIYLQCTYKSATNLLIRNQYRDLQPIYKSATDLPPAAIVFLSAFMNLQWFTQY